ncbi:hypothetical protein ACJBU6_05717 [Exserohilum turcicum]
MQSTNQRIAYANRPGPSTRWLAPGFASVVARASRDPRLRKRKHYVPDLWSTAEERNKLPLSNSATILKQPTRPSLLTNPAKVSVQTPPLSNFHILPRRGNPPLHPSIADAKKENKFAR